MKRFLIPRKISDDEVGAGEPPLSALGTSTNTKLPPDKDAAQNIAAINKHRCAQRKCSSKTSNYEHEHSDNEKIDGDLAENCEDSDTSSENSDRLALSPKRKKKKRNEKRRDKKIEKRVYRVVWERDFPWIKNHNNKPFCTVCQKTLQGGQSHLQRHQKTDFHQKRLSASTHTVALDTLVNTNPRLKAATEAKSSAFKLAMHIAEHNLPFKLLEHLTKLLPALCPDSEIAKQISCSRTKGRGLIVDILGPESLAEAAVKLRVAKFSLIIDETTDISTSKCLAVVARYFDEDSNEMRDRCLGLLEVPCCTAAALHSTIIEFLDLHKIPLTNMIGFAADNASVMMGNLNGVQAKFKETIPNLFVMGCVCHSFHLCASAACLKLPRTIEDLARDVYSYFSHSVKRLTQFAGCQEIANLTPHRLLRPSQTRWLSLQAVVNRMLEQWPALIQFFEMAVSEDNLQAASTILNALKQPIYKLYFSFLSYILGLINRLNVEFQGQDSLLYCLLDRVTEVYRTLLKNYLKNDYIARTPTQSIDPGNVREYKPIEELYVGAKVELMLSRTQVQPDEIRDFKLRALAFYVELCREIKRRIRFNDPILSALSVVNPKVATSGTVASIIPLALLFPNLVQDEAIEELNSEWRLLPEVAELSKTNLSLIEFINKLGVIKNQAETLMFPNLHRFLKALACLPHSSAAAERIFSQLNLIKTKTRNKLKVSTSNALLLTKELLHTQTCYEWKPNGNLFTKSSRNIESDSDT